MEYGGQGNSSLHFSITPLLQYQYNTTGGGRLPQASLMTSGFPPPPNMHFSVSLLNKLEFHFLQFAIRLEMILRATSFLADQSQQRCQESDAAHQPIRDSVPEQTPAA